MAADTFLSTHTACPTMNIITEKTATTFSALKSTKSRNSVLIVAIIQINGLTLNFHRLAGVTQVCPGQSAEGGDFPGHLVEQTFNAHEAVAARHIEYEFVEKFPFRSCITSRLNRFHEPLDPTLRVRKCAALFCMRASGQQIMRQSC